jgi:Rrf2 family protein
VRISTKGRYGLKIILAIAKEKRGLTSAALSCTLDVSKVYLEQVLTLLRNAGIIISTRGSDGGYKLAKKEEAITIYEILLAAEPSVFEKTEGQNGVFDAELHLSVFSPLDAAIENTLSKITVSDALNAGGGAMFFI